MLTAGINNCFAVFVTSCMIGSASINNIILTMVGTGPIAVNNNGGKTKLLKTKSLFCSTVVWLVDFFFDITTCCIQDVVKPFMIISCTLSPCFDHMCTCFLHVVNFLPLLCYFHPSAYQSSLVFMLMESYGKVTLARQALTHC